MYQLPPPQDRRKRKSRNTLAIIGLTAIYLALPLILATVVFFFSRVISETRQAQAFYDQTITNSTINPF